MYLKLLIIFFSISIFGQQNRKPYPYKVESDLWLNNYRNLQTDVERLSQIKNKIYSDTLYDSKVFFLNDTRDPKKYICKTLFFLVNGKDLINLDLNLNPSFKITIDKLSYKNIKSIKLLDDKESVILFGEKGICGVIYLECNKRFIKRVKKIIK